MERELASSSSSSDQGRGRGSHPFWRPFWLLWGATANTAVTGGTGNDVGGTNGTAAGTSGNRFGGARPYLVLPPLVLLFATVNVMSAWDDRHGWPTWLPILTEYSSAVAILCLCWVPGYALGRAPLSPPWGRVVAIHLPAILLFSLLHTAGMALLRNSIGMALDLEYRFNLTIPVLIYEGRKDATTYLVLCVIYLLFGHGRTAGSMPNAADTSPAPSQPEIDSSTGPACFDIRDGTRLLRVPVADILAIRSAGNYAEFLLADGKRPLMRATLTQLADGLSRHGLVRTHRSWLINRAHVRALEPEGSGDYAITLSDNTNAPLSRRFPDALTRLRDDG